MGQPRPRPQHSPILGVLRYLCVHGQFDLKQPNSAEGACFSHAIAYIAGCVARFVSDSLSFYARREAQSVLATATCLSVSVAGWLSVTAGIVSKRLNLS